MTVDDHAEMAEHPPRVQRICSLLAKSGCSHAVAVGAEHVLHLTGYSRYQSGPSAAVVSATGHRTLIVPRYELSAAEDMAAADQVLAYGRNDLLDFNPLPSLAASCVSLLGRDHCALAAASTVRDLFTNDGRTWVDFDAALRTVRRLKDKDELERISQSFELALIGQRTVEVMADTKPTEIELFTAAQAAAQNAAGEPIEFIAAIASGVNSARICAPLHVPGGDCVAPGGALLCDIAVRHRGYWGDSTRTYGSNPDLVSARESLTSILHDVATRFQAGTQVAQAYREMARSIQDALPGASFPHHGGHGIGIEVGEDPQIIPNEQTQLEPGMVFALEPGAYFTGRFGARVENTYVVQPNRAQLITDWHRTVPVATHTHHYAPAS